MGNFRNVLVLAAAAVHLVGGVITMTEEIDMDGVVAFKYFDEKGKEVFLTVTEEIDDDTGESIFTYFDRGGNEVPAPEKVGAGPGDAGQAASLDHDNEVDLQRLGAGLACAPAVLARQKSRELLAACAELKRGRHWKTLQDKFHKKQLQNVASGKWWETHTWAPEWQDLDLSDKQNLPSFKEVEAMFEQLVSLPDAKKAALGLAALRGVTSADLAGALHQSAAGPTGFPRAASHRSDEEMRNTRRDPGTPAYCDANAYGRDERSGFLALENYLEENEQFLNLVDWLFDFLEAYVGEKFPLSRDRNDQIVNRVFRWTAGPLPLLFFMLNYAELKAHCPRGAPATIYFTFGDPAHVAPEYATAGYRPGGEIVIPETGGITLLEMYTFAFTTKLTKLLQGAGTVDQLPGTLGVLTVKTTPKRRARGVTHGVEFLEKRKFLPTKN